MTKKRVVGCLIALGLAMVLVAAGFVIASNLPQKATPTPTATPKATPTPTTTLQVERYTLVVNCLSEVDITAFDMTNEEWATAPDLPPISLATGIGPGEDNTLMLGYPDHTARFYKGCSGALAFQGKAAQTFAGYVGIGCLTSSDLQMPLGDYDGDFVGAFMLTYIRDSYGMGSLKIVSANGAELSGDAFIDCTLIESP